MRIVQGQIHKVSVDYKLISMKIKNKLEFFYLQPRFVKEFRQYLYSGVFVGFSCDEKRFKMKNRMVSRIIAFERIVGNRYHRKFYFFDQKVSKQNILEKLNQYQYRLFLDLEMTIQRSRYESDEIIQIGAILVDNDDKVVWRYNQFVRPTLIENISKRTLQFLSVPEEDILNGIPYKKFYEDLKVILLRYKPCVIVWGNNDKFSLLKSYTINKVTPIFIEDDFINMQAILKKFYNFNYELGLFSCAKLFNIDCGVQSHNAYEDADVTRFIFNKFYEIANGREDFDFKEALQRELSLEE